jgi:hypothetical protein
MLEEKLRLEKRTVQYWYEDGIPEIGLGSTFLMMAGLLALNLISVAGGVLLGAILLTATIPYSYFCSRLLIRKFHALKERWTYPRAGRVRYRGQDNLGQSPLKPGRLALTVPIAAGTIALQQYLRISVSLLIAVLGLAALLVYLAGKSGIVRFYAFAALAIGTGALLLASPGVHITLRLALFCAFHGLILSASGAIALRHFIKTHPVPSGDVA